jgi:Uncharacterized protein conserved in bacteria (DUF2188)
MTALQMQATCTILSSSNEVFKMSSKGQHVVPSGGKWSVRRTGASRASGTFATQGEAVDRARDAAQKQGTELYIHGRDGRIRERSSYGKDSYPSKG